jgi:serine/threonine-protein kinase
MTAAAIRMSSALERLADALGDRYTVEREIGRGGMATVYLARDRQEDRRLAVKVMHPELGGVLDRERFFREISITASLDHPGIVPVDGVGRVGELPYYFMPYVEGESLFQRQQRERQLPVATAVTIAGQIAEALAHAHRRGVLHRDVTPGNILLAERAMLTDFGLARALDAASAHRLTATGMVVGTVLYASPEQLRQDRDLDQRTDVYSLGCVLYEMLAGEPPYAGTSLHQIIGRVLRAPIPSIRLLCPAAPAAVDRVITRALSKTTAERFGTMEEMAGELGGAR